MGNRAVITTQDKTIGLYLHWNGGRESIDGFLAYCKIMGYRPPEEDCYGWACLAQTCRNFFSPEGLSVGIDLYDRLDTDNKDNGVYIIKDWKVIGREFSYGPDYQTTPEYLTEVVTAISEAQPANYQLSKNGIAEAVRQYLAQYTEEEKAALLIEGEICDDEDDNALPPAPEVKALPESTESENS